MRWIAQVIALTALVACTSGPKVIDHAFSFDLFSDSPDAELLAYRYGDSNLPVNSMGERSTAPQRTNVHGPMRQGDSLYAKWRIKASGKIYEDTVDLRNRLPRDITNHRIYLMIKGPQLYVYLIPPTKRADGSTTPRMYPGKDAKVIYPN
jgi:hypothetical protein